MVRFAVWGPMGTHEMERAPCTPVPSGNAWDTLRHALGYFSALLNLGERVSHAVKQHVFGKPFVPGLACGRSHRRPARFDRRDHLRNSSNVFLSHSDRATRPVWPLWRNPLIRDDDWNSSSTECFKKTDGTGSSASRTEHEFCSLQDFGISSFIFCRRTRKKRVERTRVLQNRSRIF